MPLSQCFALRSLTPVHRDEAFTYDKRVSRIAIIQEHRMILNAVKKGVSEERLAGALNVNIANIRAKRNLLVGICAEAADILKDKHVPRNVFTELRYMKPMPQIEASQLMVAMNRFSINYAKSLVAATPDGQLTKPRRRRRQGLSEEQISLMQHESENLARAFRLIEQNYGADHLDLMLALGYVTRLLGNARIVRHLAQRHGDILSEFQKMVDYQKAAWAPSRIASTASGRSPWPISIRIEIAISRSRRARLTPSPSVPGNDGDSCPFSTHCGPLALLRDAKNTRACHRDNSNLDPAAAYSYLRERDAFLNTYYPEISSDH